MRDKDLSWFHSSPLERILDNGVLKIVVEELLIASVSDAVADDSVRVDG